MTDKQKEILKTMPKRDRGLYGDDLSDEEDKAPELVEADPLEAAIKKEKLKQKAKREKKR